MQKPNKATIEKIADALSPLLKEGDNRDRRKFDGLFRAVVYVQLGLTLSADELHAYKVAVGSALGKRTKRKSAPRVKPLFNLSHIYKNGDLIVTDARSNYSFTFVNRKIGPALAMMTNNSGILVYPPKALEVAAYAYAVDEFEDMRVKEAIIVTKGTDDVFVVHISGLHEAAFLCANRELRFSVRALTDRKDELAIPGDLFAKAFKLAEKHFGLEEDFGPLFANT